MKHKAKFKQTEIGEIPEEWDLFAVEEFAEVIGGGTPSTKESSYFGGDIPWITPKDLSSWTNKRISRGERNITSKGLNTSGLKLLPKNSVLLTSRAPVGYLAIADNPVTTNQGFKSLVPKENTDSDFVYYLLKANVDKLKNNASGSTFQELSGGVLKRIKFAIPDITEQQQIASILSSLDDKIELNRRMNNTLEEIGKALFKRWFVDFEFPNENGEPYKSSGGEMVESELGEIPRGWKVKNLGDFFPIKTGKQNANIAVENGDYPFFTCSQGVSSTDRYSFDEAAILLAGNGDFNVKWYVGKFEAYQRTYVLTPHNSSHLALLYYLMQYFLNEITSGHRGSVINFITKGMIENFRIAIPNNIDIFIESFQTLNNGIDFNKREIDKLVAIRDSLLPRLMSGKIRVN